MTWDEIAWRLGTTTATVWRWRCAGIRPSAHYLLALHDLAQSLGLAYLLPTMRVVTATAQGTGDRIRAG